MMKKLLLPLACVAMLSGCVVVVGDVEDRNMENFTRHLSIDAGQLKRLSIEAGAGSLEVIGVSGLEKIEVDADIYAASQEQSDYNLSLDGYGSNAELVASSGVHSGFRFNIGNRSRSARIDLTVRVPAHLALDVDDGSGSIIISNIGGKVKVEDGSGGINIKNLDSDLVVDDNSGDIVIQSVKGNVDIEDGSGDMYVNNVGKTLTIDDGSGDIEVSNIHDLRIEESGSGDVVVNDSE